MECCGVDDYKDFYLASDWTRFKGNRTVPEACCVLYDKSKFIPQDFNCPFNPTDRNSYYQKVNLS